MAKDIFILLAKVNADVHELEELIKKHSFYIILSEPAIFKFKNEESYVTLCIEHMFSTLHMTLRYAGDSANFQSVELIEGGRSEEHLKFEGISFENAKILIGAYLKVKDRY